MVAKNSFISPLVLSEHLINLDVTLQGDLDSTNSNIESLNGLTNTTSNSYKWRFKTSEAFNAEVAQLIANGASVADLNNLYWTDTLKTCEAYTVMSIWRSVELVRGAGRALELGDVICAALAARAALESAVQYLDAARTITRSIEPILDTDLKRNVITSHDVEKYILKIVFTSRLPVGEEYQAYNIINSINRISKCNGQEDVKINYELLCEAAHPNFLGRSVYLLEAIPGPRSGDETRVIGVGCGPSSISVLRSTFWAIGYACAAQVSAANLMQQEIGRVLKKVNATH